MRWQHVFGLLTSSRWLSTQRNNPLPDLFSASITDLQHGLDAGHFTSVDLVETYFRRIEESSHLNAVLETNPFALADAAHADAARAAGDRSPLLGLPVLIKDSIATERLNGSFMQTTAGSVLLLDSVPAGDAFVVKKLHQAGAIIIGKTSMTEWGNWRSEEADNGWNARGGQTYNAYVDRGDPSGSSSGAGVAASLGLAWATLGAETSGSIVAPADHNACVGIKPSVGLTSRTGAIPISAHQDTIGPMARTVMDAAALLQAIAGPDSDDNATAAIPSIPDYVAACKLDALRGARIGVPSNFIVETETNRAEIAAFNASWSTLRELGATVIKNADFPDLETYERARNVTFSLILDADFAAGIQAYFSSLKANPRNLTDLASLLEATHADPREEWPQRDTRLWERGLRDDVAQDSARYAEALALNRRAGTSATVTGALDRYGLDALILPTYQSYGPSGLSGLPIVSVPLGATPNDTKPVLNARGTLHTAGPNFPFSISFLGRKFDEAKLIGLAYAFEQATLARDRVQPIFKPKAQLGTTGASVESPI